LKVEQTPKVVIQDVQITITTEEAKVLYRILDTLLWDSLPSDAEKVSIELSDKLINLPHISWEIGNYAGTAKLNS
jgi:hypothetical protein